MLEDTNQNPPVSHIVRPKKAFSDQECCDVFLTRAPTFTCGFPGSLEPYSDMIFNKTWLIICRNTALMTPGGEGGKGFSAQNVRRLSAENSLSFMGRPDPHLEIEVVKAKTEV